MSIAFACDQCSKKYKVEDRLAGKRATCKGCGTSMLIPSGADEESLDFEPIVAPLESTPAMRSATARPIASPPVLKPVKSKSDSFKLRMGDTNHIGMRRIARLCVIFGICASLLPLIGLQLKVFAALGPIAPKVGFGFGLLGAVLFAMAQDMGWAVIGGLGVIISFAICIQVDPYARIENETAAAERKVNEARSGGNSFTPSPWNNPSQNTSNAASEQAHERLAQMKQRADEALAKQQADMEQRRVEAEARHNQFLIDHGMAPAPAAVAAPPPPERELPKNPVDRAIYLMQSGNRSERITAASQLLANPPKGRLEEVAGLFRGVVSDSELSMRRLAIRGMLLAPSDANITAMATLLGDSDALIRDSARKVLVKLKDERTIDPLLSRIDVDTEEVIEALRPFPDLVEPLLIAKLKDGTPPVKLGVLKALMVYGTPSSVPALKVAAKDADKPVAVAAKAAWRKIAPAGLDPFTEAMLDLETEHGADAALVQLATIPVEPKQRDTVVAALATMMSGNRPANPAHLAAAQLNWQGNEAIDGLLPLLSTVDAAQKPALASALAKTGDARVAALLAGWLKDNTDRITATNSLASMGQAAEESVLGLLFIDDLELAPITLGLLEKIGTTKSVKQLNIFSAKVQNPLMARQAHNALTSIENRRQAELKAQRSRPSSGPTTRKTT